jgi:soluble lytic murein transglycosylase-like protein
LRARALPYLRTEILLTLLAFPLVAAGCGPRQVWGMPEEALRADLASAHYASLSSVDFATQNPADALSLSGEAPFYLSFVFDALAHPAQSLSMLELAASRSPSPWKEEAGVGLAERYNELKSWDRAAATARQLLGATLTPGLEERARRALVEALYWSKEDAAVLDESMRLAAPDAEVRLFRAVSSLRLGLPAAHGLVMGLFLDERASSLHGRFATFLAGEPQYQPLFSTAEQSIIEGRNQLAQGAWTKALPLLEGALGGADPSSYAHGALLMDMGNAYVSGGKVAAGGAFMEALAAKLAGQPRFDALEQAGRLFRRARNYPRAMRSLQVLTAEAPTADQRDRGRWSILDILFSEAPPDLADRVHAESLTWSDASYFSDLLEDRISDDVSKRRWPALLALRAALAEKGPDLIVAELDYVLARAWQEGRAQSLSLDMTARALFTDAVRRDPGGYYGILASSMLGEIPDRTIAATDTGEGQAPGTMDPLIQGFLAFGLHDEAYARLRAQRPDMDNAQLLDAARRFAAAGDLRGSMYFTGALARKRKLTLAELGLYYPRGYGTLLVQLAVGAGIPDHVLFGLVREESFFDAGVVSSAGAVGLSQLMPATAAPVARALKIADPDLKDPSTNLAIGVRHLQELLKNVDTTTKALLAYNAGLSRVRQWERAAPGLPADLFIESVPIAETRGYVRKILVSSVMYAFLYHDADPREAALSFFGIRQGALEPANGVSHPGTAPSR